MTRLVITAPDRLFAPMTGAWANVLPNFHA